MSDDIAKDLTALIEAFPPPKKTIVAINVHPSMVEDVRKRITVLTNDVPSFVFSSVNLIANQFMERRFGVIVYSDHSVDILEFIGEKDG